MKKSLHFSAKYTAMCLVATGLTGATLVWAAPKSRTVVPPTAVKTPKPKPSVRPKTAPSVSPQKATAPVIIKPDTVSATQPGVGFTPSRFPGVSVRHIPASEGLVSRTVKAKPHRGLVLGKPRRIPGHQGVTVDVDPSSFPAESVQVPPVTTEGVQVPPAPSAPKQPSNIDTPVTPSESVQVPPVPSAPKQPSNIDSPVTPSR